MSAADLRFEFDNLRHGLCLEETEDNWEKIATAMQSFAKVGRDAGYEPSAEVVNALRNYHRPLVNAMQSERTRLCGTALDLLTAVATGLGREFEQVMSLFMPPLLAVCGKTNKVVINRAKGTILSIIESTQHPSSLPYFVQFVKDKSATLRLIVAEGTLACLNSCNPPDLERETRARDVESIIRGTVRDANPDVRSVSRKVFQSYKILFPSRIESFTAPLSPIAKKYLDIKQGIVATSKSSTQPREQLKPDSKPSNSTTSMKPHFASHARSASASVSNPTASTAMKSKGLASKLTRVSRKDPISDRPHSAEDLQACRPNPDSQKHQFKTGPAAAMHSGPSRAVSKTEPKLLADPASQLSRVTAPSASEALATAPRRLQILEPKSPSVQPPMTGMTGPKRVPMPIPPPAPKKEQAGSRRPASRVDNATSTTSTGKTMVPVPAPSKKNAATAPPSTRERPPTTKPPIPKFKPTVNPAPAVPTTSNAASSTTKPLAVGTKPIWGRGAPVIKPIPAQKVSTKPAVKKPGVVPKSTSTTTFPTKRPVTPVMVDLPPSPSPAAADVVTASTTNEGMEVAIVSHNPGTPELGTPEIQLPTTAEQDEHTTETPELGTPEIRLPATAEPEDVPPSTPQGNLIPNPAILNADALGGKTPISALLFSIERGFVYSPTTPLSPADSYLPGPNGTVTYSHETHEGPMQPFNHALHATPKVAQQEMKFMCGTIGVVDVNEHDRLYAMTMGLPLPAGTNGTGAFVESRRLE